MLSILDRRVVLCACSVLLLAGAGCGTTKSRRATEQLLLSDAVDRSIAELDFSVLQGHKVYLDSTYITHIKTADYVNSDYITSSLRQQLFASGCLVQDIREDADYVVEARIGALGADDHELVFGLPATNVVSTAGSLVANSPPIPAIPEISLAKRNDQASAAKIAVFAYHRETKQPIWQSGVSRARGRARDFWIFGAGPFQKGTIYDGTRFAGNRVGVRSLIGRGDDDDTEGDLAYDREILFQRPPEIKAESTVELAGFEEEEEAGEEKTADE